MFKYVTYPSCANVHFTLTKRDPRSQFKHWGEEAAKENFLYHDQSTCGKSYNLFYPEL